MCAFAPTCLTVNSSISAGLLTETRIVSDHRRCLGWCFPQSDMSALTVERSALSRGGVASVPMTLQKVGTAVRRLRSYCAGRAEPIKHNFIFRAMNSYTTGMNYLYAEFLWGRKSQLKDKAHHKLNLQL